MKQYDKETNIKHYEREGFVEKYANYIKHLSDPCPYIDPDSVDGKKVKMPQYYEDLVVFLNAQEKEMKKDLSCSAFFFEPNSSHVNKKNISNFPCYNGKLEPLNRTILMSTDDFRLFLSSDQFGFSADKKIYSSAGGSNKYPYVKLRKHYLEKGNCKKESFDFIAQCVNDTRTIGGSFIWPKICDGRSWKSFYNVGRGARNYIMDRVDLTLMEIKIFYEALTKFNVNDIAVLADNAESIHTEMDELIQKHSKGYIKKTLLLSYMDKQEVVIWLAHFKTFENYVNFFCFNDFVAKDQRGECTPINIMEYDGCCSSLNNIPVLFDGETKEEVGSRMGTIRNNNDIKQIKQMVGNVRILTLRRSKSMEDVINKYKNCERK